METKQQTRKVTDKPSVKPKMVFAIDPGCASSGFAVYDGTKKTKDHTPKFSLSVETFLEGESAKNRRASRSARKMGTRKDGRRDNIKKAFDEFGLIPLQESTKENYLLFKDETKTGQTIYSLRAKGLTEQLSYKELMQCLVHLSKNRGHFLMEDIDFVNSKGISRQDLEKELTNIITAYVELDKTDMDKFKKDIIDEIIEPDTTCEFPLKKADMKNYVADKKDKNASANLWSLFKFFSGNKVKLDFIPEIDFSDSVNAAGLREKIEELPSECDANTLLFLYDSINIYALIKDYGYICLANLAKLKEHDEKKNDKDYKQKIKNQMNASKVKKHTDSIRCIRNLNNNYPNGLIMKEALAILKTQQTFDERISDEFISIIAGILRSHIPYYVGPLGEKSPFGWCQKKGKFKYSYEHCCEDMIDEYNTMHNFKRRIQSKCNYLPENYALSKGSILLETFQILNSLNVLTARKDNKPYYLSREDKILVMNELFLQKKNVTYAHIKSLLHLDYFGTKAGDESDKFTTGYTVYFDIIRILPILKLSGIEEIFTADRKMQILEDIVLQLNILLDKTVKKQYMMEILNLSENDAEQISKLSVKGFGKISKEFLMDAPLNKDSETLLSIMFKSNTEKECHEINQILFNAKDSSGASIDFTEHKWMTLLKDNPEKSFAEIFMEDDIAMSLPMSRAVIRSLNESMKEYKANIQRFGIPDRVIIETARDMSGTNDKKKSTGRLEKIHKTFDSLKAQYKKAEKEEKLDEKPELVWWNRIIPDSWDEFVNLFERIRNKNTRLTVMELYLSQGGFDLLTGERVNLRDYQIDHLLYRGFGDDSKDNKCLENRFTNDQKTNRTPLEAIESEEGLTNTFFEPVTKEDYLKRVGYCKKLGLISDKKVERLLLEDSSEAFEFINRNLTDTNWITKEFVGFVKAYNKLKGYDITVVCMSSSFTSLARRTFNFSKNRSTGKQHHAYDAAMLIIMDGCLQEFFSGYENGHGNIQAYKEFYAKVLKDSTFKNTKSESDETRAFIRKAFACHFGTPYTFESDNSLIHDIKNTVPYMFRKKELKTSGGLFNQTLDSPSKRTNPVLLQDLLGINKGHALYTHLATCGVDIYRWKDKKGKINQCFVQIPKCITDGNGKIDEVKYRLVADFLSMTPAQQIAFYDEFTANGKDMSDLSVYKTKGSLIDENGKIRQNIEKIHLLNGDIVYDTISKSLSYYSGGSIVKKKIYLYSLDGFNQFEMDKRASKYKRAVSEHFNFYIHGISPKDGTYQTFNDVDIREIVEYAIQNLLYIKRRFIVCEKDSPEKREQAYQAVCKNIREVFYHYNKSGDLVITCTGFKDFVEKLAYNSLRLSLKETPQSMESKRILSATTKDSNGKIVRFVKI